MTSAPPAARTRHLLALPAPSHASLSPDGEQLLLTTTSVATGELVERSRTELIRVTTGERREFALMGADDHSPTWAPDGARVAWCATADGAAGIAIADGVDGPVRFLPTGVEPDGAPIWSADGSRVAFPAKRGVAVDRTQPFRWTRPILAFDGLGALDDPPQLRLLDIATGEGRWLTDDDWRWGTPCWSPDGTRLAATISIDPTGRTSGSSLRVVHVEGGAAVASAVAPDVPAGRGVVPAWLPDGRLAALVAEPRTGALGGAAALFVIDGVVVRRLDLPHLFGDVYADNPAILPETYEHLLLADTDGSLVCRTGARGRMGALRVHPDRPAETTVLLDGDRCCTTVALAAGRLVFTTQHATAPAEVAVREPDGSERLLTDHGAALADSGSAPDVRRFTVDSEGWPIDAWLLTPAGATTALPTVVLLHGGPHFTYGEGFHIDAHALVAAGFAVLVPNVRGSTGYGDAFAQAVHGDWAEGPTRDVFAVVDHAVAQGWIDGDRLGVTGNSYGGYLSAWLVATTDRFRAAVIENPVTDLVAMYGTSDIGATYFPPQIGGRPHEALARYRDQSPLLQAHRCTTPCLFVVGEADRRCPPSQAWSMHRVLCEVGTVSEMLVLPNSWHEGSTYGPIAGRLAHDDALVEWMTRWL
jgi:dipeptidyl aminopeptidase/acylaminoacyl peptidase